MSAITIDVMSVQEIFDAVDSSSGRSLPPSGLRRVGWIGPLLHREELTAGAATGEKPTPTKPLKAIAA
ncbi:MAG: hypothetical protein WAN35_13600 [Terracidiphilus sp.]